jgi:MFS family permease
VWIVGTQVLMIGTLMAALPIDFTAEVKLFTFVILLHNCFCATQDVAIDALACNVLKQEERGIANGLMFGGAYLGQAIGGSGVLYLIPYTGLPATYIFVSAVILSVTLFIALPLQETKRAPQPARKGSALETVADDLVNFAKDAGRAIFLTRAAFVGVFFALLPGGAYALSLSLQSNLAVELGLTDERIATLSLISTVVSALSCVLGGWLSDRFGRRKMLGLFFVGTALPTLYLAWVMYHQQWIMPIDPTSPDRPQPATILVNALWIATIVFAVFNGLMYGARSALFMDITTAAVAATQFTAYMAMLNLVISYSAAWQGYVVERIGYPLTLVIDALAGLLCIGLLPFIVVKKREAGTLGSSPTT